MGDNRIKGGNLRVKTLPRNWSKGLKLLTLYITACLWVTLCLGLTLLPAVRSTWYQERGLLKPQSNSFHLRIQEKWFTLLLLIQRNFWPWIMCLWVQVTQSCPTLCDPVDYTGQNTGVDSLSLLQGIFLTQGLNPGLPHWGIEPRSPTHCRQILYQLSHQGSPRILELVAYPFSSGSSQPRNLTRVSCIAGRFFTNWAIVAFKEHWIIVSPAWITCPSHWMEKIIINESPPGSHGVRKRSPKEREPPHQEKGERKASWREKNTSSQSWLQIKFSFKELTL